MNKALKIVLVVAIIVTIIVGLLLFVNISSPAAWIIRKLSILLAANMKKGSNRVE